VTVDDLIMLERERPTARALLNAHQPFGILVDVELYQVYESLRQIETIVCCGPLTPDQPRAQFKAHSLRPTAR